MWEYPSLPVVWQQVLVSKPVRRQDSSRRRRVEPQPTYLGSRELTLVILELEAVHDLLQTVLIPPARSHRSDFSSGYDVNLTGFSRTLANVSSTECS